VEQFAKKAEGEWILKEYKGEDTVLILDSVEFKISFKDIYERVDFDLSEE
jgi:hypothetical protein